MVATGDQPLDQLPQFNRVKNVSLSAEPPLLSTPVFDNIICPHVTYSFSSCDDDVLSYSGVSTRTAKSFLHSEHHPPHITLPCLCKGRICLMLFLQADYLITTERVIRHGRYHVWHVPGCSSCSSYSSFSRTFLGASLVSNHQISPAHEALCANWNTIKIK